MGAGSQQSRVQHGPDGKERDKVAVPAATGAGLGLEWATPEITCRLASSIGMTINDVHASSKLPV